MPEAMLSDIALANLELDSYGVAPIGDVIDAGCDRAVITRMPAWDIVSILGTRNLQGWLSDFDIWEASLRDHLNFGPMEAGFADGAEALWAALRPMLGRKPLIMQGHSRGASLKTIMSAMALRDGFFLTHCIGYEEPWTVGTMCRDILLANNVPGLTYWNGNDPVPTQPDEDWLVPNVWPIVHVGQPRVIAVECHYMANVLASMASAQATA
jgi:hypothetical protein